MNFAETPWNTADASDALKNVRSEEHTLKASRVPALELVVQLITNSSQVSPGHGVKDRTGPSQMASSKASAKCASKNQLIWGEKTGSGRSRLFSIQHSSDVCAFFLKLIFQYWGCWSCSNKVGCFNLSFVGYHVNFGMTVTNLHIDHLYRPKITCHNWPPLIVPVLLHPPSLAPLRLRFAPPVFDEATQTAVANCFRAITGTWWVKQWRNKGMSW